MNQPEAPRIFYGYYIVAACFFILFFLWGMVYNTFPIFLKPMTESMGWGRGAFAGALLVGSVVSGIASPIVGKIIDNIGAKYVMVIGAVLLGCTIILESRITQLWHLYILFGVIGLGLMCATIIPCSLLISNWFVAKRGTAMSAAFIGTSAGGMVMSPVANWIIVNYSWRTAFVASGTVILVLVVPLILFVIRTHPKEMGLSPLQEKGDDTTSAAEVWGVGVKEAFSLKVFWQIGMIMLIVSIAFAGMANHCVAYMNDIGHSPTRAAFAWSVVMGVMILGKLAFGPIADKWGAKISMAISCLLFVISMILLMFSKPYAVVLIFAAIYGFASGSPLVINPLLTGEYLGVKHFGALFGILNIMGTIGGAVGPIGAGIVFDVYHTYVPVFYFMIAIMLICAVIALVLKPIPHGRLQSEDPLLSGNN